MTSERIIGLDGGIPWRYSEDLKRFKRVTMDCNIVMGRYTWESINEKALPGRRNIVVSSNPVQGAEHFTDVDSALNTCEHSDTWIIGGGQIYAATLSWVTLLDVTYVPDSIDDPRAIKFPVIDPALWDRVKTTQLEGTPLTNVIYHRK